MSILTEETLINGVLIHPIGAYPPGGGISGEARWELALLDKIPEMGEGYMELYLHCNFDPFLFIQKALEMGV